MSNDLTSAITTNVLRFREQLRRHVTPWAVIERLHASSRLLRGYRIFLYAAGICCIAANFVPSLSGLAFRWGWRLLLSYPIVVLLYLAWWERLLRRAQNVPCRLADRRQLRLPGLRLLPLESLNGRHLGHLLVPAAIHRSYGFAQLAPADQLTALQTRMLFWKLLLPPEIIFDALQPELTNLTQQWEENESTFNFKP